MNQITFTKPKAIYKRDDGLTAYQYELKGLVSAICTTFCKTLKEAIENAKQNISKYLLRVAEYARLTEKEKEGLGVAPKKTISGWDGIKLNQATGKWDVTIDVNSESIEIGSYAQKSIAVTAKKNANKKYGLSEFSGKLKN